jgi:5'-nucleotidase (lipoprotein e(P4) family)
VTFRSTLFAIVLVAGCRSAAPIAPPPPTAPAPTPPPVAAYVEPDSIRWVRSSAEYAATFVQTYRLATAHVERVAEGKPAGTWGVVLDADETVISNLAYQAERAKAGQRFTPESWAAWVKRREATPLPGAAAFLARVRALGGRIAIVTNRRQSECDDTAAVFTTHTLVYDAMLCRPDDAPSDKNPRFQAVAAGTAGLPALEIVAFVGDNILDFPWMTQQVRTKGEEGFADFGARFFVLPNPMYGSWQQQ